MGDQTKAWGIAGLVTGILGLVLFLAPYLGIVLSILATVFYGVQKKHQSTGPATAGLVLGIIGIVVNGVMLLFVVGMLAMFGMSESADGASGSAASGKPTADTITCPDITTYGDLDFKWGESIQGTEHLYLYADFLNEARFSNRWELTSLPASTEFNRDSFVCEKGAEQGRSVKKLYCEPTFDYEPRLRRNAVNEDGEITDTDYQYIDTFVFDAENKDLTSQRVLDALELESITCSPTRCAYFGDSDHPFRRFRSAISAEGDRPFREFSITPSERSDEHHEVG